ncbi:MAG: hypothetical protein QNL12_09050 [Acidimicrobiia bacterium]|nr:hypothetical protein [Acidimicrobiia bacterium]MDX2467449.1 hypothetical protein [Acidimicrobiia bacterium]
MSDFVNLRSDSRSAGRVGRHLHHVSAPLHIKGIVLDDTPQNCGALSAPELPDISSQIEVIA